MTELVLEESKICFRFPAKMAAAQQSKAVNTYNQNTIQTVDVRASQAGFGLQVIDRL